MKSPHLATSATLTALIAFGVQGTVVSAEVTEPSVIPAPVVMHHGEGAFSLTPQTIIHHDAATGPEARYLAQALVPATGFELAVQDHLTLPGDASGIVLSLDPSLAELGDEGYRLVVSEEAIAISAPRPAGVFYGVQTVRQLLPVEIFADEVQHDVEWRIPAVEIEDWPRFGWRGQLLDVGRHFFDVETVKRTIDLLALHKMNRFHWHLTEDQGWRIEIKRYPRLTEVGAWRTGEDGERYGGYYTQDEIREVIEYAAERHILVVPEIDMPGHSLSALASYPFLGCTGGPYEVATTWGIFHDVLCVGSDDTMTFVFNVLDEVMDLFPSRYIHIGGDEVPKDRWRECPRAQRRMAQHDLADEEELQSWFIREVSEYLDARGRRLIGWDEILEGGLAPGAIVQSWRGMSGGIEAASLGHDVIMSPTSHCYLDYSHTTISLERAYSLEPIPDEIGEEAAHHVLGIEGNTWTEWIPDRDQLDHQVYPRLTALAEVAWSPREARDWDDFYARMQNQFARFDLLGVAYATEYQGVSLDGATTVAKWLPEQMSEDGAVLEWDVTRHVTGPGQYDAIFYYTAGACAIEIEWAALIEDETEVARDEHLGWSGANKRDIVYQLPLEEHDPEARYTLRAWVASSGGTDSTGDVRLRGPEK